MPFSSWNFYYFLLIIAIIFSLSVDGLMGTSILFILDAATLPIGLSLQAYIINLTSRISITFLRPLVVGDFAELVYEEAFIAEFRFSHTLLLTRDNLPVFVPNRLIFAWGVGDQ